MSAAAPWVDLMRQTVTREPYASQNQYGKESYGAATTHAARVVGKRKKIIAADGSERVSMVTVYFADDVGLDVRDRLTLPEEFTPRQPEILAVAKIPDEEGNVLEVAYT